MKSAILALWAAVSLVDAYRILCVFPVPSASHNILGKGIVDALLEAGHQVWWATPYPKEVKQPSQNLSIIDVSGTQVIFESVNMSDPSMLLELPSMSVDIAYIAASAPEMQQTLLSEDFDAVVTEWFHTDLPAGYAAALKVPWILLSSVSAHPMVEELVDDVTSTALVPTLFNRAPLPMNFWQRVANSIVVEGILVATKVARSYVSQNYTNLFEPIGKKRGTVLPPLSEVYNNVSIMLVNSHPLLAPAQSFPPNVVDIGGYFISENATIPQDLKKLLDSSTQGFVYFSLGSIVKMSELPISLKQELANMFGELPYTVLWRSNEEIKYAPKNVLVRKWFPQAGILAHPNIKLFITHSGLLSTIEALHYGVPLLAVPVFADQPINADRAVAAGFAVKVDFHSGVAQELRDGLTEMVNNDRYYKTAKHLAKLFHKRPTPSSKLIPYYIELAIESQGAYHLRSQARHYPWHARARADQLLFAAAFCYGLYTAASLVVRQLCRRRRKQKTD